jgi:hypothetical protein
MVGQGRSHLQMRAFRPPFSPVRTILTALHATMPLSFPAVQFCQVPSQEFIPSFTRLSELFDGPHDELLTDENLAKLCLRKV